MGLIRVYWTTWVLVSVLACDETNLKFMTDFTSNHNFHSSFYNLIVCKNFDSISLIKTLSEGFERFVAVHEEDEGFGQILDEPQTFILNLGCPQARQILQRIVFSNSKLTAKRYWPEKLSLIESINKGVIRKWFQPKDIVKSDTFDLRSRTAVSWCSSMELLSATADNVGLLKKPYRWILLTQNCNSFITNGNTSEGIEWHWNFLETLSILIDSDFKVIEKTSDGDISVIGAYKITKDWPLLKEPLAKWSQEDGLTVLNIKSVTVRRINLQGVVLPTSLVITNPGSLKHLDDLVDKHIDVTPKVSYNFIKHYEDHLNMRISYKIVDGWGVFENGSWTGMMGDIERGVAEFGGAALFVQEKRMATVEYYAMVNPSRSKFIFLSPPVSYSNNIFLMPFDAVVWYCCLSMVAVSCFLLFTALRVERPEKGENDTRITFTEILLLNVGAICLQGTVAQARGPAGRMITLFLYLSYMFLYISYSASIVAILQSSDNSIKTLADILNSPLKAGADNISFSRYYFTTADDELRKSIYRVKIAPKGEPPHFLPVEEGVKKVREGLYAYHVETSSGYQIIQKTFTEEEKCGLQESRTSFFNTLDPWLAMKRKTPYGEILKFSSKKIIESGFKSWAVRRYYTKKPECSAKGSRFVSVGIFDCYYAFVFLMCGTAASIVILVFEVIANKYTKRKLKKEGSNSDHVLWDDVFMNQ